VETTDGKLKLLVAEGESVPGHIAHKIGKIGRLLGIETARIC
jgi:hypothetical protein